MPFFLIISKHIIEGKCLPSLATQKLLVTLAKGSFCGVVGRKLVEVLVEQ
jgi:hypothetical protein